MLALRNALGLDGAPAPVVYPIQNTFSGTAGANFTTTSSVSPDTNPSSVALGTSATATYSTAKGNAQTGGTTALAIFTPAGTAGNVDFPLVTASAATRRTFRFWLWVPSAQINGTDDARIFTDRTASANIASVFLSPTGGLQFRNAAGTTVLDSGATLVPTNQWVLIQGASKVTGGVLELAFWSAANLTTPLWSNTASGQALGSAAGTNVRLNTPFGNTAATTLYFDDLAVTDTLASGWIGPRVVATSTTGQAKVYTGSAFVAKPAKVWTGSAWVTKPVRRYDGSTWVVTPY